MTEASKARKRNPTWVAKMPRVTAVDPYIAQAIAGMLGKTIVLPPGVEIEVIAPKRSTPPKVTTYGVSCRMGVGGRRGRKRRRAEERKAGGRWFVSLPSKAPTFYETARRQAKREIWRLLLGSAALAPSAAAPSR